MTEAWDDQLRSLGTFIRAQRKMANLSLRKAAELADISNPYWSQLERGMHEPSVRVLTSIARALNISAEALLEQAGMFDGPAVDDEAHATEAAIRADAHLSEDQKLALLTVYRSYVSANGARPNGTTGNGTTGTAGNGAAPNGAAAAGDHDRT